MNKWSHRFSQNTNEKLSEFLLCVVRAEILTIFCLYSERNDDFINSFWNKLTFRRIFFKFQNYFYNSNLPRYTSLSTFQTVTSHGVTIEKWEEIFFGRFIFVFAKIDLNFDIATRYVWEQGFSCQLRCRDRKSFTKRFPIFGITERHFIARKIGHGCDNVLGGKSTSFEIFKSWVICLFAKIGNSPSQWRFASLKIIK